MPLMHELDRACRTMNFAPATRSCYRAWVEDYLRFHKERHGDGVHPDLLRERAVECYLGELAVERELAASSQTQALCAQVFLPHLRCGHVADAPEPAAVREQFPSPAGHQSGMSLGCPVMGDGCLEVIETPLPMLEVWHGVRGLPRGLGGQP